MTEPSTVSKMQYRGKPPPRPHHTSRTLVTTVQEGDSVDWTDTEEEADEDVNLSQDDVTRILVVTTRMEPVPDTVVMILSCSPVAVPSVTSDCVHRVNNFSYWPNNLTD